jgi:hypothetical protein
VSAETPPRFPSRVDPWIGVLLVLGPVVAMGGTLAAAVTDDAPLWFAAGPLALFGVLYTLLVWPVDYTLGPETLIVRFGLIRLRLPYAEIRSVEPTADIRSSPALSLERLRVEAGPRRSVNISPADRAAFMAALAARCPHLRPVGDALRS